MKQLTGTVLNTTMPKTVKLEVLRRWAHPLYKKTITKRKKYLAHCQIKVSVGDKVIIQETRPISKRKKWKVVKKL
jgi:small subunit ribosomal protein S17